MCRVEAVGQHGLRVGEVLRVPKVDGVEGHGYAFLSVVLKAGAGDTESGRKPAPSMLIGHTVSQDKEQFLPNHLWLLVCFWKHSSSYTAIRPPRPPNPAARADRRSPGGGAVLPHRTRALMPLPGCPDKSYGGRYRLPHRRRYQSMTLPAVSDPNRPAAPLSRFRFCS